MILYIASNGSYLSETKSRIRVGGILYLSSKLPKHNQAPDFNNPFNAPFHVVAKILKMITSSATETEVAATFYNSKEALPFRANLTEMGHPQPPTPMHVVYLATLWLSPLGISHPFPPKDLDCFLTLSRYSVDFLLGEEVLLVSLWVKSSHNFSRWVFLPCLWTLQGILA